MLPLFTDTRNVRFAPFFYFEFYFSTYFFSTNFEDIFIFNIWWYLKKFCKKTQKKILEIFFKNYPKKNNLLIFSIVRRAHKDNLNNFFLPIIGSIIGRSFSFLLTFPLEPLVVKVQGSPASAPFPKMSSINYSQGLIPTYSFELAFAMIYWSVFHNLFPRVNDLLFEGNDIVKATLATGIIANVSATTLSHPLDVIRTMKVLDSHNFGHLGAGKVLKKVYNVYGSKGFLVGKF